MDQEEGAQIIDCELYPGLAVAGELKPLETPPPAHPGLHKIIQIEGLSGLKFRCFTGAHPEKDHVFETETATVKIPWYEFSLHKRNFFLEIQVEITWK